jgi:hypothetical protein
MNIFKTFTLTWWQSSLFKFGLIGLGIIVGAYWHDLFAAYFVPIGVVAAICLVYVTYVWWKQ